MPSHNYIFAPSREFWPASSVNARIPPVPLMDAEGKPVLTPKGEPETIAASAWLDKNHAVEQMTWCPGLPMLIRGRLVSHGGWIERPGCVCFNLYRPPTIVLGDAAKARPWLELVQRVFPDDADHIVKWLAHRVQRPQEKINHALVLGGEQGIGKDTILEPVKHAIGPWNFEEVSPAHMLGRFNGFVKNVILRVSEARDLGGVDEKNIKEYAVFNVCGVILTTNHKTDGIYLPTDDRRHYVAWSERKKADFSDDYWNDFYAWLAGGGNAHVAAYLSDHNITDFDPKAPPPKTDAFWSIVDSNRPPEDAELDDALDEAGRPAAFTIGMLEPFASAAFREFLADRRNRRQIPHRLETAGYCATRNPYATDGLWKTRGRRQVIYALRTLSVRDRIEAAQKLVTKER
jgi:hypothetical protein